MSGMNPAEFANIAKSERDFWWYRGMREILARALESHLAGRRIARALEIGCGTGYQAALFQEERGWPLIASDLGWEGLRYARQLGVKHALQCDAMALPFPCASFDFVMSLDMIVHLPRPLELEAAREWTRVLAPGGLLVVRAAALDLLRSRHSVFAHERQRFTRARLVETFARAGVRMLSCTYANTLLAPVAFLKFRVWEPLLRRPAASGVEPVARWLDRLLYAPLSLEAKWIGAGRSFAIGQSLLLIGERMAKS
jgi:SAM-dependent methyltransferase